MTANFNQYENAANEIINLVGKNIVIGIPLGLGKPIGIINALYQLARADTSIHLTIFTALTFARPIFKNELEKKFIEPILNRILGNYEEPLYEKDRTLQQLPHNITVIEFFLLPGKFLHNSYVQQNYISSSYTNVVRDIAHLSINVLAQSVAPSSTNANLYSLSCNSDLFHDMQQHLKKAECEGRKIAIVAEVNSNLPYMYGDVAEINSELFSVIVDTKDHKTLFAVPRDELSTQDHLIGLYTSSLIQDNGCLQIGIGKLSNALANALIFRHKHNTLYCDLMKELQVRNKFGNALSEIESFDIFDKGLYASTEMLSDEYMQLYNAGILKKRVYDHIGLQTLLNSQKITETITPDLIDVLIENKIINAKLTPADFEFLQKFGIFHDGIVFDKNGLHLSTGESFPADLSIVSIKQHIIENCLGKKLKSGKIIHAGFFFGSVDFYSQLKKLPHEELIQIDMTSIARTNSLFWSPELLQLQRLNARFVNSTLMVTLLGGVISDGLNNYQEISGVGGQYDFVSMANQLNNGRSIIICRSTRETASGVKSNIVWDYANSTLPRYLRDFVITEYGIADCRGKTDSDVIKAILNIADSRFQHDLLKQAKKFGKLAHDYCIPEPFLKNRPGYIDQVIHAKPLQGHFKPYPFGSDLTPDEEILARALIYLKNCSKTRLVYLMVLSLFFFKHDAYVDVYLQRMDIKNPKNIKDFIYKKLLKFVLHLRQSSK